VGSIPTFGTFYISPPKVRWAL